MISEVNFFNQLHTKTPRNYLERMNDSKVQCMEIARQFGKDFFDGERRYGFGGYKYDGRWMSVAKAILKYYNLQPGARILEVGCGKGYLLYELTKIIPDCQVTGFDISDYAITNCKQELAGNLFVHDAAKKWPVENNEFDLVISIAALHNLPIYHLKIALEEMNRVAKSKYLCVEAYRNPAELFALQCWALTAECFFTDKEWVWLFNEFNYNGNYEFIYF